MSLATSAFFAVCPQLFAVLPKLPAMQRREHGIKEDAAPVSPDDLSRADGED